MVTRIQKWGNSQGLRVTKHILDEAQMSVGDEVEVVVGEGKIIVQRSTRIHGKYTIEDLVARIPKHYKPHEETWGTPVGKEVW